MKRHRNLIVGVALSLLNAALSSTGLTMQRKAHLAGLGQGGGTKKESGGCKPLWVAGVIVYILAAVPDVLAYAMIPQVVCSTVACSRLVMVALLARVFLEETLQFREVGGMALCCLGTCLCLWFGPPRDPNTSESANVFYHPQVFIYLLGGSGLLFILLLFEHLECMQCNMAESVRMLLLPFATALAFALEKVFNTELGFMHLPHSFRDPGWFLMSFAIALCGLLDFYLNLRGAQRLPVQVFVPLVFAFTTSLLYLQSIVVFNEFEHADLQCKIFSACGALLSLCGALCIQPPGFERSYAKVGDADEEDRSGESGSAD